MENKIERIHPNNIEVIPPGRKDIRKFNNQNNNIVENKQGDKILKLSKIDNSKTYNNTTNITNNNITQNGGILSLIIKLIKIPYIIVKTIYNLLIIKTGLKENYMQEKIKDRKYKKFMKQQRRLEKSMYLDDEIL